MTCAICFRRRLRDHKLLSNHEDTATYPAYPKHNIVNNLPVDLIEDLPEV